MAPQRGVPQSPCNIKNFCTIIFCDVSKTTYKKFGGLGCAQFFWRPSEGHHGRQPIWKSFYGADPANIKNAVNFFARDVGPQTICMYLSIPSRDILSPKSKYCTGFDVRPHNDWTTRSLDYIEKVPPVPNAFLFHISFGDVLDQKIQIKMDIFERFFLIGSKGKVSGDKAPPPEV